MRLIGFVIAGLFAFFFTGTIVLSLESELSEVGQLGIQAGGGFALFVLVFLLWRPDRDDGVADAIKE